MTELTLKQKQSIQGKKAAVEARKLAATLKEQKASTIRAEVLINQLWRSPAWSCHERL